MAICCSAAVAATAFFADFPRLGGLAALCLVLQAAYRISPRIVLKRLIPAFPLILFLGASILILNHHPDVSVKWARAALIGGRTIVVLWSLALLPAALSFAGIVRGLSGLGIPRLFSSILFFAARYETLLLREAGQIRHALILRTAGNRRILRRQDVLACLAFRPVERAFERSERIHAAMLSRGWNGIFPVRRPRGLSAPDFLLPIAVGAWIAALMEVFR